MRIRGERTQKRELLVREPDLAIADPYLAPPRIDEQIADPPRAFAAAVSAPQHRADTRGHLLVVERLAFRTRCLPGAVRSYPGVRPGPPALLPRVDGCGTEDTGI